MQSRQLKLIHLLIILCLAVFAYSTDSVAKEKDGLLKIYFFDVGQGDSIFIESPNGNQVLIDGGPGNTVLSHLGRAMSFYDKDIDLVIMTHPDADHASGLVDVLERYNVENVMFSNIISSSSLYGTWKDAVKNEMANTIDPVAGTIINLGDGVNLNILYPLESLNNQATSSTNNNSIVAMLKYKELEVLLTGDIELKGEREMLVRGSDIDADILKIAHHGSKTSTMEEFLSEVSPETAIIQVGEKNRYNHPAPEVLERLENYGIKYYRTDTDGTTKISTDGNQFLITNL